MESDLVHHHKKPKRDIVPGQYQHLCEIYTWTGDCPREPQCPSYHSPDRRPYLWLIEDGEGEWVCLSSIVNDDFENIFCHLYDERSLELQVFGIKSYDFRAMEATMDKMGTTRSAKLRRLSTPSYVSSVPGAPLYFYTQWIWYWQDQLEGIYSPFYPGSLQYTLEEKYLKGQQKYYFEFDEVRLVLDLHRCPMVQKNLDTGRESRVVRRPVFVESQQLEPPDMSPLLLSCIPEQWLHEVPGHWACADNYQQFEMFELTEADIEYSVVEKKFFETMEKTQFRIVDIFRVQNPALWDKYCSARRAMTPRGERPEDVYERRLFHGTPTLESARGICCNSFDFRRSGENAGAKYGRGAYFSTTALYSHEFTSPHETANQDTLRFMFLGRILVGQYTLGHSSYSKPPPRDGLKMYDSCVNDMTSPSIFVLFDLAQSYPEYLIQYTEYTEKVVSDMNSAQTQQVQAPLAAATSRTSNITTVPAAHQVSTSGSAKQMSFAGSLNHLLQKFSGSGKVQNASIVRDPSSTSVIVKTPSADPRPPILKAPRQVLPAAHQSSSTLAVQTLPSSTPTQQVSHAPSQTSTSQRASLSSSEAAVVSAGSLTTVTTSSVSSLCGTSTSSTLENQSTTSLYAVVISASAPAAVYQENSSGVTLQVPPAAQQFCSTLASQTPRSLTPTQQVSHATSQTSTSKRASLSSSEATVFSAASLTTVNTPSVSSSSTSTQQVSHTPSQTSTSQRAFLSSSEATVFSAASLTTVNTPSVSSLYGASSSSTLDNQSTTSLHAVVISESAPAAVYQGNSSGVALQVPPAAQQPSMPAAAQQASSFRVANQISSAASHQFPTSGPLQQASFAADQGTTSGAVQSTSFAACQLSNSLEGPAAHHTSSSTAMQQVSHAAGHPSISAATQHESLSSSEARISPSPSTVQNRSSSSLPPVRIPALAAAASGTVLSAAHQQNSLRVALQVPTAADQPSMSAAAQQHSTWEVVDQASPSAAEQFPTSQVAQQVSFAASQDNNQ